MEEFIWEYDGKEDLTIEMEDGEFSTALVETLKATKDIFLSVPEEELESGKYTVKVPFKASVSQGEYGYTFDIIDGFVSEEAAAVLIFTTIFARLEDSGILK